MYADEEAGGVGNSFKNMMEADPDFGKKQQQPDTGKTIVIALVSNHFTIGLNW